MKTNMAKLRGQLSAMLDYVEQGKELEVQRRNITIAKIVPVRPVKKNMTKLGAGKGTVKFLEDVTTSIMDTDWEMLK